MASVNRTTIIGRVGRDPETRTVGDVNVCSFSVATSETFKDKSGEKKEDTTWFNVSLWRGLAEVADKYIKKGDLVYIEGRIKTREYQDKEGIKRQSWELVGDKLTMLGSKSQGNTDSSEPAYGGPSKSSGQSAGRVANDEPDDLPF